MPTSSAGPSAPSSWNIFPPSATCKPSPFAAPATLRIRWMVESGILPEARSNCTVAYATSPSREIWAAPLVSYGLTTAVTPGT